VRYLERSPRCRSSRERETGTTQVKKMTQDSGGGYSPLLPQVVATAFNYGRLSKPPRANPMAAPVGIPI
jgi:hypothetical protein